MARKFLYIVAALIILVIAVLAALRIWGEELTRMALTPSVPFEEQAPIAPSIYDDGAMWFSRPGLPPAAAQWMPEGWEEAADMPGHAVFFIHPTSYLKPDQWNAPVDDPESQDRAKLFLRGMASPFNKTLNLWAPRYRQAAIGAFLTDKPEAGMALDAAYGDVLAAFDVFVAAQKPDTPIILAGHSQGSLHLTRLLRDRVAGQPLAKRIVAAYVIGWPISLEHDLPALGLPACAAADQTGCILSWSSFAEPAEPEVVLEAYGKARGFDGVVKEGSAILCTNPLTGMMGGEAPATANPATLVPSADLRSGTLEPGAIPAKCDPATGMLLIGPPPDLGPYVLPGNNYHVYDYPLFWGAVRNDVARRSAAFGRTASAR